MKKLFVLLALSLSLRAQADDNVLWTTDGFLYKGITLERVEPDGIYIEYPLPGGGLGMSKIKFTRLSRTFQQQYGYNRSAAQDYESQVAQANADLVNELNQRDEIQRNARHQRDEENQRVYESRMAEIKRLNDVQAAAFYRSATIAPYGNRTFEISQQFTSGHISTQTSFTPAAVDLFPNRTTTVKLH